MSGLVTVLDVPMVDAELAADRLWSAGARAVEQRDVVGDRYELRTALGPDRETVVIRLGVLRDDWVLRFDDRPAPAADTWRRFARPVRVNDRVVIRPAWSDDAGGPDDLVVAIEPGAAFGLGDHPTTRLAAAATDRLVAPGDRVLDVGCGSGVLAVIAARRGAEDVVAIDVADEAVAATNENARLNGVDVAVSNRPIAEVDGRFDLVLANILAPVLVELAPDLRRVTAPHGHLVVSGVLAGRFDHVVDALAPMELVGEEQLEGWSAVEFAHPGGGSGRGVQEAERARTPIGAISRYPAV